MTLRALIPTLAILAVAGCDAPTHGFARTAPIQQVVQGSHFNIYHDGNQAQAVRTNVEFAPRIGPLATRAVIAMQQATGCRVSDLAGDAAVLVGRLSCTKKPRPACAVDATLRGQRGYRLPIRHACTAPLSSGR